VAVAGLTYAPTSPKLAYAVELSHGTPAVANRWPGSQLTLVADAREHLVALLSPDGSEVLNAIWSDSAYLSCLQHNGLSSEIRLARAIPLDDDPLSSLALLASFPPGLRTLIAEDLPRNPPQETEDE
jgi:hypothetical protein